MVRLSRFARGDWFVLLPVPRPACRLVGGNFTRTASMDPSNGQGRGCDRCVEKRGGPSHDTEADPRPMVHPLSVRERQEAISWARKAVEASEGIPSQHRLEDQEYLRTLENR